MASGAIAILVATIIYAAIGATLLFFVHRSNNSDKGLLYMMVVTATLCLWLFWVCTYMAQLNPLIGPEVKAKYLFLKS